MHRVKVVLQGADCARVQLQGATRGSNMEAGGQPRPSRLLQQLGPNTQSWLRVCGKLVCTYPGANPHTLSSPQYGVNLHASWTLLGSAAMGKVFLPALLARWSCQTQARLPTPPRSGEKNPTFRCNIPASRFFSKRGSRCPGSQSQGANTPSFWLFCSWSNVETQSRAFGET